jgi:radical SAM superfamily enzyme YgiQ (UPF0313 family)
MNLYLAFGTEVPFPSFEAFKSPHHIRKTMKIIFIQPSANYEVLNYKDLSFMEFPPLTFPTLAAHTPHDHSVTMIDERIEKIDFRIHCDLVGITSLTCEALRAYEIADEFRKRGTTVVLGGPHVSILPKEAKTHADSIVIGEAEESWPRLLRDYEKGELQSFYQQKHPTDLQMLHPPDMSLLTYHTRFGGVQTSRGCPNGCKFCYIGNSKDGRIFRKRPIEQVIQEIKRSKKRTIMFYDASMTIDVKHTKALFRALRGLNKRFLCLGNIDVLGQDDELLRLSKEAGVVQWSVGFESVSQESLSDALKRTNMVHNYSKAIEKIHAHNIMVRGFFVFGFDHDKNDIFEKTVEFVQESHLDSANFGMLTPLPGLPLFKELEKQHRIHTIDWDKYGFHQPVVFKPKELTESELLNGYNKAYRKYYSWDAITKRFLYLIRSHLTLTNLFMFFAENIIIRTYCMYHVGKKKS